MLTPPSTNEHAATPLSGLGALVDERRVAHRTHHPLPVSLTAMGSSDVHRCRAENISEGGLYLTAPSKCTLTVGQRCEIVFADDSVRDKRSTLAGERCYATVVRTERPASGGRDVVAAGLRFDQPLFI